MIIDKIWTASCDGNINVLKKYFSSKNAKRNIRYCRFGQHSLIMGAYRNNQFDTVEYLLSVGETVTEEEMKHIQKEIERLELLKRIEAKKRSDLLWKILKYITYVLMGKLQVES